MDSPSRQIASLQIRRIPLADLHLDPANARLHPEANMAAIEGSLARFGQAEPLVVQKSTGRVIGGNGRLVAMKSLGWTECVSVTPTPPVRAPQRRDHGGHGTTRRDAAVAGSS